MFNLTDKIYVKIAGIEGETNLRLQVSYNLVDNYKVFCPRSSSPPLAKHSSAIFTDYGTVQLFGAINETFYQKDFYLFNEKDEWEIIEPKTNLRPSLRVGAFIEYYEKMIIIFGGQNADGNFLNDLWLFDMTTRNWFEVDYKNTTNIPSPRFLTSGTILETQGKLIIFGGKNSLNDNNLCILDLAILFELYQSNNDVTLNKINNLWTLKDLSK